jgi:hypothetical protein
VGTGADKSGHKPAKVVQKITEKEYMFTKQVSQQLLEDIALELVQEEIMSNCTQNVPNLTSNSWTPTQDSSTLGGRTLSIAKDKQW